MGFFVKEKTKRTQLAEEMQIMYRPTDWPDFRKKMTVKAAQEGTKKKTIAKINERNQPQPSRPNHSMRSKWLHHTLWPETPTNLRRPCLCRELFPILHPLALAKQLAQRRAGGLARRKEKGCWLEKLKGGPNGFTLQSLCVIEQCRNS